MEEKNLEEKDPQNNMDSRLTDTTKENNLNKDEFIDALLGRIDRSYTLSNRNDKNLEEMTSNDVESYVKTNYSNLKEIYSDEFLRDLTTFKIYRDNLKASLEYRSQTCNYFETLGIAIITTLITIVLSAKNKDWGVVELIFSIAATAVILSLLMKYVIYLWRRCKNSKFNKLKIVNESIYILEYKKEKLTQNSKDKNKEIDNSKDSQHTEEKTMGIKIRKSICTLSKPLPNSLKNATNEEVIEYINDNYLIRKDFTKDEVKNDLIAFKNCRNDLGRNFKNGEIILTFLAMMISVLALLLTASLAQFKSSDLKTISDLIIFAAAVYVMIMFYSILSISSKKKGSGKLVALQYAIDVLEMKKEELESEKKD